MLNTKRNFLILGMLVFSLSVSVAACETKSEKKTEETKVVVKDTTKKKLDTTAVARPRQPGE